MTGAPSQRGAALVIVLLLAASLSAVAMTILLATERTQRQVLAAQNRDQAVWDLLGAERIALGVLGAQDAARPGVDVAAEDWLGPARTVPLAGRVVTFGFRDVSNCIDLNAFAGPDGDSEAPRAVAARRRFGMVVAALTGDGQAGEQLAARVADVIDADTRPLPGGAEDYAYGEGEAPYRTSGTPLASVGEVRAVRGWTAEITRGLAPYLCALPPGATAARGLNLNTLRERDLPLLAAALDGLFPETVLAPVLAARPPDGWDDVETFLSAPAFSNIDPPIDEDTRARLGVTAHLVEFSARAVYDGTVFELTTLIERTPGGRYRIRSRRFGPRD